MSRIISIGTAVPQYSTRQHDILEFMQKAYADETASRKLNILFNSSGINTRHSVVPDFDKNLPGHSLFNGRPKPQIEERLNTFKNNAISLATDAISDSLRKINTNIKSFAVTHLITVTCTGLHAPGLDAEIIKKLGLPDDIFHTSINFMGCNAAFPAMKIADMIAKTDKNSKILVVCVELCTLHFQPKNNNDNLLSNTIFGDGAAALLIVADDYANENNLKGLAINGFYSCILGQGEDLMGWNITPLNFEMILNAEVPAFIGERINQLVLKAGDTLDFNPAVIEKWAIHPGGKRILDMVKKNLKLSDEDLIHSYNILRDYGNMSSPTILFVLNQVMYNSIKPNDKVFSIGFGPGICFDTSLFTYAG